MSNELKKILEPDRMEYAEKQLQKLNISYLVHDDNKITFFFKGELVTHFVYTGWHTGKSINDGRGIHKLLSQVKNG